MLLLCLEHIELSRFVGGCCDLASKLDTSGLTAVTSFILCRDVIHTVLQNVAAPACDKPSKGALGALLAAAMHEACHRAA